MAERKQLYRISDLERLTDIPRRRIHFYIQSGLLHKPMKTGKTMAYYDDSHREKLLEIKEARDRGEPLFMIKEALKGRAGNEGRQIPSTLARNSVFEGPFDAVPFSPKKTRRNSEVTRERILCAGCDMFRENGYKNTKVNDLTRHLNIGKGTFYFYFSDKKELFLECVPRLFEEMFSEGWDELRQIYNPVDRLERRFELVLAGIKEFCAILQLAREAMEDPDPKLKGLGNRIYRSVCKPVESDIYKGIKRGVFFPVDIPTAANLMIAAVESIYYMQTFNGEASIEKCKMHIFNLLVYGLAGMGERLVPDA
jgi:AcrR family transcriptional regulator